MKILVTGGAGFIGSHLALRLLDHGYSVVVMDNLSEQIHGRYPEKTSSLFKSIAGKVEFYKGCVTVQSDWEKVLNGVEIIVHLAAETGTGQSMYEVSRYTDVNIGGTALMLNILANNPNLSVRKVVIASSRSIYGEGKYFSKEVGIVYPKHRNSRDMLRGEFEVKYPGALSPLELLPTDEESMIHPSSVYGITKQNQEQMVRCVCQSLNIDFVAFRYQNVYGPGQSLKNPYTGILSIFSTLIKTGKALNIFEDGTESRDFVYIDDVIRATVMGLETEKANGEIFNVGSGVPITVLEVAQVLVQKYGQEVPINVTGNFRLGDIRHNYADLKKIKEILEFEPEIFFEEGVQFFVNWVKEQQTTESLFQASIVEMKNRGLLK